MPYCTPAKPYICKLMQQASDADWSGEYKKADRLRKEANQIKKSGADWVPLF